MIIVEHDDAELDFCASCRGVWVDAGELDLFLDGQAVRRALWSETARAATREERRRCPMCRTAMDKARAGQDPAVTYDQCSRGHGFWFDDGELALVLKHGHPGDEGDRLAGFLRALFHGPEQSTQERPT